LAALTAACTESITGIHAMDPRNSTAIRITPIFLSISSPPGNIYIVHYINFQDIFQENYCKGIVAITQKVEGSS
jgi:hypothetical protein